MLPFVDFSTYVHEVCSVEDTFQIQNTYIWTNGLLIVYSDAVSGPRQYCSTDWPIDYPWLGKPICTASSLPTDWFLSIVCTDNVPPPHRQYSSINHIIKSYIKKRKSKNEFFSVIFLNRIWNNFNIDHSSGTGSLFSPRDSVRFVRTGAVTRPGR